MVQVSIFLSRKFKCKAKKKKKKEKEKKNLKRIQPQSYKNG